MARILVIEDDECMNSMIVQLLSEAGYEAEGSEDGSRGLALLDAKPFDLIVTDIIMPEMEGLETIFAIRKKNKSLPIIAISGGGKLGPDQYLHLAKHFGAEFTFQKPFHNDLFLNAVRRCISGMQ